MKNSQNFVTVLATGYTLLVIGMLLSGMLMIQRDIPDVHISNSTKKCVKVVNYGHTSHDCTNYPEIHNRIIVE